MADDFSPEGQLAQAIPGFKPREPQRQMAHAVAHAIDKAQPLVVEAGTGTGKTYAYLAPALRAKKKVIISTGSRAPGSALQPRFTHGGESAEIQRASGLAERAF